MTLFCQCCLSHSFFWNRERDPGYLSLPSCLAAFFHHFKSSRISWNCCMLTKECSAFPDLSMKGISFFFWSGGLPSSKVNFQSLWALDLPLLWIHPSVWTTRLFMVEYFFLWGYYTFICTSAFMLRKCIVWWVEGGTHLSTLYVSDTLF